MKGLCVVAGCGYALDSHAARGLCPKHYRKWRLYGDPLADHTRSRSECSALDCQRPAHARTLCIPHYARWTVHGDTFEHLPVVPKRRLTTVDDRFWSKVDRAGSCWLWTATRNRKGYGQFGVGKRLEVASRFAWTLTYGSIPDGLWVLHRCDNPPCVRPEHLFLGTAQDNTNDMIAKGREAFSA